MVVQESLFGAEAIYECSKGAIDSREEGEKREISCGWDKIREETQAKSVDV